MTSLLPLPTVHSLTEALVPAGLATPDARAALLQGIHAGFVLSLPNASNNLDQVRSDLATMNQVPMLDDGQVPLRIWLENAAARLKLTGRKEVTLFQQALAELDSGDLGRLLPEARTAKMPPYGSPISPSPQPLGSSSRRHLETQHAELQRRYNTLTQRLAAVDTDIGRELDSERKLVLQERRAELDSERNLLATDMDRIELQLMASGGTATIGK